MDDTSCKKDSNSCIYCDKVFEKSSELKLHVREHIGEEFLTESIGKGCTRKKSVKISQKLNDHGKSYACFKCDYSSTKLSSLKIHLQNKHKYLKQTVNRMINKRFHKDKESVISDDANTSPNHSSITLETFCSDVTVASSTKKVSSTCIYCGQVFETYSKLKLHVNEHAGETFPFNSGGKDIVCSKRVTIRKRRNPRKPYNCPKCDFCSSELGHLIFHFQKKHECPKHIARKMLKKMFAKGVENSPAKKNSFPCTYCDRVFPFLGLLMTHVRKHTHEKPFICDICGKGYAGKKSLEVHMRTHTGNKSFACPECDYYSYQKSNLDTHLKRYH